MKRIQYHKYGGPEVMKLETYTMRVPKEKEVLVRVKAASTNPMDHKLRGGILKIVTGWKFPNGVGADFAGVVEAVGAKVTEFKAGDEVVGTTPFAAQGAFAEQVITEARFLVPKPASLPFDFAATLPIVGLTAWTVLVKVGHLSAGQKVFVNGALGSVGRAGVQLAKERGATVAGRVGPSSIAEAQAMGINPALDYTKDVPSDLAGQFDIVFDTVGTLTAKQSNMLVGPKGIICDIVPGPAKFLRALYNRRFKVVIADSDSAILKEVIELASQGKLSIPVSRSVPLSDAALELLSDLETGKRKGKAVITVA